MNGFIKKALVLLSVPLLLSFTAGCPDSGKNESRRGNDVITPANLINSDLKRIREAVELLAMKTEELYGKQDELAAKADRTVYKTAANGVFYKAVNDGGSALFISGYVPISEDLAKVAYFTEPLDAEFKKTCADYPEAVQVYYNDRNSLNRIYPWFDVLSQYQAKMNIPEFNFYYLADQAHNPGRKGVWVKEPYIDPAGRGWMISTIAPAYWKNTLEGVCGIDMTIESITARILNKDRAIYAIFTESGTLVSASDKAMSIMLMPPLKSPKYLEAVDKDLYMEQTYNICKSRQKNIRELGTNLIGKKLQKTVFMSRDVKYDVYSAKILELDWFFVHFIP
jgi:hypothetical protein